MNAIILAAGKGERLHPLTENKPKQLLPLGNQTILDYVLKSIESLNPSHTFISTNSKFVKHFEDFIENFFYFLRVFSYFLHFLRHHRK